MMLLMNIPILTLRIKKLNGVKSRSILICYHFQDILAQSSVLST